MDEKVAFVPFNAINEFMIPEYRQVVIQKSLAGMNELPAGRKSALIKHIKRSLAVPGFRNSSLAPLPLKVKAAIKPFEKNPEFTAQILECWCELNSSLSGKLYELLKERGWELLPVEADRTQLPGFMIHWPEGENYDLLDQAFAEKWPDDATSHDDIRLMAVWLSGRLPYEN